MAMDETKLEYVTIDQPSIAALAAELTPADLPFADWSDIFPEGLTWEQKVEYLFAFITIDFHHWDLDEHGHLKEFYATYDGEVYRGSEAMTATLKRSVEHKIRFYSWEFMTQATRRRLAPLLAGHDEHGATMWIPAIEERAKILRQVGFKLKADYEGTFLTILKQSGGYAYRDGAGIIDVLTREFPRYQDVYTIDGEEIPIHKLAQLLVAALHCALGQFGELGDYAIKDLDRLDVCADYQLPRALRDLGILVYSPELARKVDSYQLIAAGSREEFEIRYASILAARKLREALSFATTAPQIDYFLWQKGRHSEKSPHHLSETIMY